MGDSVLTVSEVGEISGAAPSHVVLVLGGGELGPEFEETNDEENLPLGGVGDGVPKLGGVGLGGELDVGLGGWLWRMKWV